MDSKGTIQKVQNLMQGIEIIVQKRMFDEFPENVDVRDYVNKETSIRNEIKNELEPSKKDSYVIPPSKL
ncbi:MAG: hypothetical protein EKK64_02665 [Neisseriaceae bacterium]|nr:MAG: hypothetical protein EKK64_02665 [Neisseriaceae bacterium]